MIEALLYREPVLLQTDLPDIHLEGLRLCIRKSNNPVQDLAQHDPTEIFHSVNSMHHNDYGTIGLAEKGLEPLALEEKYSDVVSLGLYPKPPRAEY